MKNHLLSFASIAFLFVVFSQNAFSQEVYLDVELAKKAATEEGKNIALVFSGSDWCKPCIQMKENILDSEKFEEFSNENLVYLEADFPYRRKNQLSKEQQKHNESLAEQYNPKGNFPLVVILDNNGLVKGEMTYDRSLSVDDYIAKINKVAK